MNDVLFRRIMTYFDSVKNTTTFTETIKEYITFN